MQKSRHQKLCLVVFIILLSLITSTLPAWAGETQPVKVKVFDSSFRIYDMINIDGILFITVYNSGINKHELWKSDGTVAGTVLVKGGFAGPWDKYNPSFYGLGELTNVNGTLFFTSYDDPNSLLIDREIWKSDGTTAGTVLVKDEDPRSEFNSFLPSNLINVNGTLFFSDNNELWKSDGTSAGTVLIKNSSVSGLSLTSVSDTLFFIADNGLWKSNGTTAGTVLVKDMSPGGDVSYPSNLTNVNGTLFFSARKDTYGDGLWRSDGTTAGTILVKDLSLEGHPSSFPSHLTNVNGTLFFTAISENNGNYTLGLWRSNGSVSETVLVRDFDLMNLGSFIAVDNTLFFTVYDSRYNPDPGEYSNGVELWRSDGTTAGTVFVKNGWAGDTSFSPGSFTTVNGSIFFSASDKQQSSPAPELWKSDGTTAGTVLVKDDYPSFLTDVNGTLFFLTVARDEYDVRIGAALWKLAVEGPPSISIAPNVSGKYFIEDVSVPNQIDALVSGGNPSQLIFNLNNNEVQQTPSNGVASATYDMGSALQYSLKGTSNILAVEAQGNGGSTLATDSVDLVGVVAPSWLTGQPTVVSGNLGDPVTYKYMTTFPEPPFGANTTPPTWIPFLGGQPLGILKTQGTMETDVSSNGAVSSSISGESGFGLGDSGIKLTISGNGTGTIKEEEGLQIETAGINIDGEGRVEGERGVADVIPGLKNLEDKFIIGKVIKWFNARAKLKAAIEAAVGLAFNFKSQSLQNNPDDSELVFEAAEGTISNKAQIALIISLIEEITAEGRGGGGVKLTAQVPADPLYIKETAVELFAELTIKVWRFEETFQEDWNWVASFTNAQENTLAASESIGPKTLVMEPTWEPMPRNYAVDANSYSVFQANQSSSLTAYDVENLSATETVIASNVFPDGHPSIATGEKTIMVWVHDEVSKPLMQGEEIRYSIFDGVSWQTPQNITNDSLQDFHPQVAFDNNNKAVAIWERNKNTQSATSELNPAYTNAFEIAYAVWDGQSWSNPALLTDNSVFDHAPKLIKGNDGQLFALWRQNGAGELLGDSITPDTLMMAQWSGSGWSAPQAITSLAGLLGYSVARHNNDTMSLIYSQDTDDDYSTIADQELFQLTWNGSTWSGPTRLTNDTQPDNKPSLFYTTEGQPQLLWMKGDTLYGLIDDLTDEPRTVLTESSASMLDYSALRNQDDNLVVFWQGYSDEGVDVWYTVYNNGQDAFGPPRQLTQDEPLEKFISPSFAPNGDLMIAYNKTELLTETVQISPTLSIENVTTFGETDLAFLQTTINFNPSSGNNAVYLPVILKN